MHDAALRAGHEGVAGVRISGRHQSRVQVRERPARVAGSLAVHPGPLTSSPQAANLTSKDTSMNF